MVFVFTLMDVVFTPMDEFGVKVAKYGALLTFSLVSMNHSGLATFADSAKLKK
jgi:hypothetical protein